MNEQPIETTPQEGTTVTEDSSEPVDPIEAELSTLREKMDSERLTAKQKITEMGQDRADLRAQLESQQAEIDNLRRGGYADNQPQEEDVYQRAVREMAHEIVELKLNKLSVTKLKPLIPESQNCNNSLGLALKTPS